MIKIGFVGAGNRIKKYNLPVLLQMKDKFSVVGYNTRRGNLDEEIEVKTKAKFYSSIESMSKDCDLLLISIPAVSNTEPIKRAVKCDKPILLETPLGMDVENSYNNYNTLLDAKKPVGVIEQWPYLPMENFKKQIIKSGILGDVVAVENDYRSYEFHGIAQLRSYLKKESKPVDIKIQQSGFPSPSFLDFNNSLNNPTNDYWKIVSARMNDNSLLTYKYTTNFKRMPFRFPKGLQIFGTRGTIYSDCLFKEPCQIKILNENGETKELEVIKKYELDEIQSISTSADNQKISWENSFYGSGLDEHQVAIAQHFDSMWNCLENSGEILYKPKDSFEDMALLYGLKF